MPDTITPPPGLELDSQGPVPPPGLELDKPEGQKTGFLGRIGQNLAGVGQLVKHPYETVKSAVTPDPIVSKEAADAFNSGHYGRYALSQAEAVPLVGPIIRQTEQDIGNKDYGAIAGNVATGLVGRFLPKAVRGTANVVSESPALTKVARAGVKTIPGGSSALKGWDFLKALGQEESTATVPRKTPAPPMRWNEPPEPQVQTPAPPVKWNEAPPAQTMTPAPTIRGWRGAPEAPVQTPAPPIRYNEAPPPRTMTPAPAQTGSNARPVVQPAPQTKAPPLRWNEEPPTVPATPAAAVTEAAPVVNTVPGEIPSPKPSTPGTQSSTVLNTAKKKKAAAAISEELGGGGKPITIPAEDTSSAANQAITKGIIGKLRKKGITPEVYRSTKAAERAGVQSHIREYVKSRGLDESVAGSVIDSLEEFALGGIVDTAPAQKSKVRKSKRGILYGPPKELRKLQKSK